MATNTEERLAKIEKLLLEEERFSRIERWSVRVVALALLILALLALLIWGIVEFIAFAIERIHALNLF